MTNDQLNSLKAHMSQLNRELISAIKPPVTESESSRNKRLLMLLKSYVMGNMPAHTPNAMQYWVDYCKDKNIESL